MDIKFVAICFFGLLVTLGQWHKDPLSIGGKSGMGGMVIFVVFSAAI